MIIFTYGMNNEIAVIEMKKKIFYVETKKNLQHVQMRVMHISYNSG